MQTYVKVALYGCMFAVLFVPLVHAPALYFPAITGKAIYFYTLVQLSVVCFAVYMLTTPHPPLPRWSALSLSLLLFIAVVGVASITSDAPAASVFSNFERMDGWFTLLHIGVFFYLLTALCTSEKIWNRFFLTSVAVSVVVSLTALVKYAEISGGDTAETRVAVLLGNATFLGAYAMLHTFLAGYLAAKQRAWSWLQITLGAAAVLNLLTIVVSGTRAALLGLLAGLGVVAAVYFVRTSYLRTIQKLVIVAVLGVVGLSGVAVALHQKAALEDVPMVGRLLHLTPETITEQPRYFIWKAAVNGFLDRPLLGWGADQFSSVYNQYYSPETKSRFNVAIGEDWIDRAHNMYLEWLVAGGVVALAGYLFLLGYTFYVFARYKRDVMFQQALLLGLVSAYAVNNLFAFDSLSTYVVLAGLLGYAHFCAPPLRLPRRWPPYISHLGRELGAMLALGAVGWALLLVTIPAYTTAHRLVELARADDGSDTQLQIAEHFASASLYAPWHVRTALADEVYNAISVSSAPPAEMAELVDVLKTQIAAELAAHTPRAQDLFVYCQSMRAAGDVEYARTLCEQARERAPHTQTVLIELGQLYREQKQYGESLDVLRAAFLGEPEYDPARVQYAAALIYTGALERARELLMERFGVAAVDREPLLRAYIYAEDFDTALKIIDAHLAKQPGAVGYHISRVSIYLKRGEQDRAIAALRDMMQQSDRLQAIGSEIIERIESGEDVLGSTFEL